MRVLVIDTCGAEASVAVGADGTVVAERRFPGRAAAERLVGEVRAVLEEAGVALREMTAVAVVRGPGSFTGVRVGLAAAKGMAEGAGLPLVGLSRLEVMAASVAEGAAGDAVVTLEAGRGELFWGEFRSGVGVAEGVATMAELRERFAGREVRWVEVVEAMPGAVRLAERRLRAGEVEGAMLLDALYLRRTEQELLERQAAHRARA